MPDDTIVIKAPAGTKARWVNQSQREGMKLSIWVIEHVDRPANQVVEEPCTACGSYVVTADGPGLWMCALCGLVA